MKYFRLLAALALLAIFILPTKASAAPAFFQQNGNSFGQDARLGTNDAFSLIFKTGNTEYMKLDTSGNLTIHTPSSANQDYFTWDNSARALKLGVGPIYPGNAGLQLAESDLNILGANGNTGSINFRDEDSNFIRTLMSQDSSGFEILVRNPNFPGSDPLEIFAPANAETPGNRLVISNQRFDNPLGILSIYDTPNTTVYIGANPTGQDFVPSTPSCIVMGDSDGNGVTYVTANDGVLSASITKPATCD